MLIIRNCSGSISHLLPIAFRFRSCYIIINWIVDWRKRQVEIYTLDYDNNVPRYYLWKTIADDNKDELKIVGFPHIQILFDDLFDEIEP